MTALTDATLPKPAGDVHGAAIIAALWLLFYACILAATLSSDGLQQAVTFAASY